MSSPAFAGGFFVGLAVALIALGVFFIGKANTEQRAIATGAAFYVCTDAAGCELRWRNVGEPR